MKFLASLGVGMLKDKIKDQVNPQQRQSPYTGQIQNIPMGAQVNVGGQGRDYLLRKLAQNDAMTNYRMRGQQY